MKIAAVATPVNRTGSYILLSAFLFLSLALDSFAATGENRVIAEIELDGNNKTKSEVILKELTFKKGYILTDDAVNESRQNLLNTELFSEVSIKEFPWHDGLSARVVIELTEKYSFLPLPILTRTSDGEVRLGLRYEEFNLAGRASYLKLRLYNKWEDEMSTDLGLNSSIVLEGRKIFHEQLNLYTGYNHEKGLDRTYTGGIVTSEYKIRSDGYSLGFGWEFTDKMEVGASFSTTKYKVNHMSGSLRTLNENTINSVTLFSTYNVVDLVGNYIYDGYETTLSLSHADERLGSDLNTDTFRFSFKNFIPLKENTRNFAYRFEGAYVLGPDAEEQTIDIGGGDSLRGYEKGEFQGNKLLQLNSEYRFPMTKVYWGGVLFVDAANAWPKGEKLDLDQLKWSSGFGLRLFIQKLVKGVFRVDFSYNFTDSKTKAYLGSHHSF